jgi:hypothetical protein
MEAAYDRGMEGIKPIDALIMEPPDQGRRSDPFCD